MRCPVSVSVSVSVRPSSSVALVALWPSPLALGPALDQPPSGSSGTSNPYLRSRCIPFFGTGVVGAVGLPRQGPQAVVVCRRAARVWCRRRPQPARHAVISAVGPAVRDRSGGGWGSIPSPPPSVLPHIYIALSVHSGGFVPLGQCVHSRGVNALQRLDSPSHSLAVPPGVFRHSVGLAASSVSPHSGGIARHSVGLVSLPSASHSIGIACRVSRRPATLSLAAVLAP